MKIFTTLTIIIFLYQPVWGQQNIKFESIVVDGNISQISTTCIMQDSQGFVWFGTRDGLFKYDGYGFTAYRPDPQDSLSISNNYVTALIEDHMGYLWIGTLNGLNRFDPATQQFKRYRQERDINSLSSPIINSLLEDQEGVLWIGTRIGLNCLDKDRQKFKRYLHAQNDSSSISHDDVTSILEDASGTLWVGTNGGLNVMDRKKDNFRSYRNIAGDVNSLSHDYIRTIYEDQLGVIWVGTYDGLGSYNKDSNSFVTYTNIMGDDSSLSNDYVRRILEDRDGNFWIGTWGGGLNLFDRKTGKFERFDNDPNNPLSINGNNINEIYEDASGVLWFATDFGPNKLVKQKAQFNHYRHVEKDPLSLVGNNVIAIYQDNLGTLWVSSRGHGISWMEKNSGRFNYLCHDPADPNSLSNNTVTSIYEGNDQKIWMSTYGGGINYFDYSANKINSWEYSPEDSSNMSSNRITVMLEDNSSTVWAGFPIEGLCSIEKSTGENKHYVMDGTIWCLFTDSYGIIWVGTSNGGLYKYNTETNQFSNYRYNADDPNSIGDDGVQVLIEDHNNMLWVGTKGGLSKFDPTEEKFINYTTADGLPSNVINGIIEDTNYNLWLSSNAGIARLDPLSMEVKTFDVDDGLQGNNFNRGATFIDSDGWIYFGGVNGLNKFHPDSIVEDKYIPPVVLTNFQLSNRTVAITGGEKGEKVFSLPKHISKLDQLELSYRENVFSFEFAALHYSSPEKNKYAYKMEGFDDDWSYTDASRRFATYTNLDAGSYTFMVRGTNKDGMWNEDATTISISISPAPWKSWWAYTLYVLVIIAATVTFFRWRVATLRYRRILLKREVDKKTRELKEAQAQLIHSEKMATVGTLVAGIAHEINNPLNFIHGGESALDKYVKNNLKDHYDKIKPFLETIEMGIKRATGIVLSLNRFSRSSGKNDEECDIKVIIENCLLMLRKRIDDHISIEKEYYEEPYKLLGQEGELHQVILNVLINAVQAINAKGGKEEGTIRIVTQVRNQEMEILIEDNGVGISDDDLDKVINPFFTTKDPGKGTGLGMSIAQKIVNDHHGDINFESEEGEGTKVSITLPLAS